MKKKQIKTVQNNSYEENWLETTYFWVEVINTKRKLRGKVGHVLRFVDLSFSSSMVSTLWKRL